MPPTWDLERKAVLLLLSIMYSFYQIKLKKKNLCYDIIFNLKQNPLSEEEERLILSMALVYISLVHLGLLTSRG